MMTAKEWDIYMRFLRSTVVAQAEASDGLQDITEAACKTWMTSLSEDVQTADNTIVGAKPPSMSVPTRGTHYSDRVFV